MSNVGPDRERQFGSKGCLGVGLLGLVLGVCLLLGTCVSKVEVAKTVSPDGKFIARVFEINGGATTDFAYEIDISRNLPVRWDHAVAGLYESGRSDCAYGVNVRWPDSSTLLLTYKQAKSVDIDPSLRIAGDTVKIIANDGIDEHKAPCGGMDLERGTKANVR